MNVITIGTFDLFHAGHVKLLKRCQRFLEEGDHLTIGVNTDDFVQRYKGDLPVVPESSRFATVQAYGHADFHDGDTAEFILRTRMARNSELIVIGSDWARKDYLGQLGVSQKWLDAHDLSIAYVPYTKGISSTIIKARRSDEQVRRVVKDFLTHG